MADEPRTDPVAGQEAAAGPTADAAASRGEAIRFAVLFVLVFGGLYGALSWWDLARETIVAPWTHAVATTARWAIHPFQDGLQQSGNLLFVRGGHGIDIVDGCNGITPLSLLVAGLLAFPTTWRARAWGFLIGVPAVLLVNLVRIVALWFLGLHFPDWFDRSHLYIAQAFVILATGGVWLWWLGRFAAPVAPPPAAEGAESAADA